MSWQLGRAVTSESRCIIIMLLLNFVHLIGASRMPIGKGEKTAVAKEANSVPI